MTGSHIRQILTEFSLVGGKGPPIDFRTDAAPDVTALIQRSGIPREYTVTRAGPQNHDSVGSVERGVREVKEGIATIRLELAKENCDLQCKTALQAGKHVPGMSSPCATSTARWRTTMSRERDFTLYEYNI